MKPPNLRLPAVICRSLLQSAAVHSLPISEVLGSLPYDFSETNNDATVEFSALFELAEALVDIAPFDTVLPFVKIVSYEKVDEFMTLMVTGKSMRSCLENISSLIDTIWSPGLTAQYHSSRQHDYLRCEMQSLYPEKQQQFLLEFVFGTFLRVGPLLTGQDKIITEVHFTGNPLFEQEYEEVFQCPILFNQQTNQLVLLPNMADRPLASHCPPLEQDALDTLRKKIVDMARGGGVISQVIQVLKRQNNHQPQHIDTIADGLGMSVRSLQRKLKEAGATYSSVRVEFLIEESKALLLSTNLTMDAIAESLAFSDRAAFSRAFKRIVGVSPSEFRESPLS